MALALAILAVAPAAASVSARTVTPERYVRAVCNALADWVNDTAEEDQRIFATLEALNAREIDAATAKKTIVKAYKSATSSSRELAETIQAAGAPDIDRGKAVSRDYLQTVDDLRKVYARAAESYAELTAKGDQGFYEKAFEIEGEVGDGFDIVGQPLEQLQGNETLLPIIEANPTCADVIAAYSSGGPPSVNVGECLSDTLVVVSCAEPHFGEVFFVGTHPAGLEEPFPGESALEDFVEAQCSPAFEMYVGTNPDLSSLGYSWYQPDDAAWATGDRVLICSVVSSDNSPLTVPVRGSGL